MKSKVLEKLSFWKIVGILIVLFGIYATYERITKGLGATTNLSDEFPWGIWIGFDILIGVGLAAGGFLICAITHIFNIEKYKPLARPAILTAFLGYLLVVFGLLYDLGRPFSIWHAIIMWNPKSVMFEVAWCVMLYSTVLFLEFSPVVLEKFKLTKLLKIIKKVSIPLMILGVILSTLHQSSLGSLFLIVPTKMHPLWYSPLLPVYFYLSAIAAGFAMVIFESYLSARAFNKGLELDLLSNLALFAAYFLVGTVAIKLIDISVSGKLMYLFNGSIESVFFLSELLIGLVLPVFIFSKRIWREDRRFLYFGALLIIIGFMLNRINVSITSISYYNNISYFPSIYEIGVSMMLVVLGMWAFGFAVKYFDVYHNLNLAKT